MYRLKSLVTVQYMNEMNLTWTLSFYSSLIFMPRVSSWSPDVRAQKPAVTCLLPVGRSNWNLDNFVSSAPFYIFTIFTLSTML